MPLITLTASSGIERDRIARAGGRTADGVGRSFDGDPVLGVAEGGKPRCIDTDEIAFNQVAAAKVVQDSGRVG